MGLANTLSKHSIYYLLKSGNISTCYIICLSTNCCIVSLSSIADVSVDCLHDSLELSVNFLECPRKSLRVLAHLKCGCSNTTCIGSLTTYEENTILL